MESTEKRSRTNALSKRCKSGSEFPSKPITNHVPRKRHKATGKTNEVCGNVSSSPAQISSQKIHTTGTTLINMEHGISPNAPSKCFEKLKLQLFPIDDFTRKGLEKDKLNPFLELTLGFKKKISSVVCHIHAKWGMSDIASGELVLFPYVSPPEDLGHSKRWSLKDSSVTAADVHAAVGSPAIFRLRYGWLSNPNIENCEVPHISQHSEREPLKENVEKYTASRNEVPNPMPILNRYPQEIDACNENEHWDVLAHQENYSLLPCDIVKQSADKLDLSNKSDHVRVTNSTSCLLSDLSNISFGAVLREAVCASDVKNNCTLDAQNTAFQHLGTCDDSFDAAIAAHMTHFHGTDLPQTTQVSRPSILDAEETCHAFQFQNVNSRKEASASSRVSTTINQCGSPDVMTAHDKIILTDTYSKPAAALEPDGDSANGLKSSTEGSLNISSDLGKLDFNLSESVGPWSGGLSTARQMVGGDDISISGLLGSLDAFQNFSEKNA